MFTFKPEKYFFSPNKTLALEVDKEILPQRFPNVFMINDIELVLKDSFHISIFPICELNQRYHTLFIEEEIGKIFFDFIKENPIEIGFSSEFRFVVEGDLKSVVIMCEHKNITDFYKLINQIYNLNIEMPVPHVTLYILKDKFGIYLLDRSDVQLKSKEIVFNNQ